MERVLAILSSLDYPLVVVDSEGTIRGTSKAMELMFPFIGSHRGRSIANLLGSKPEDMERWLDKARAGLADELHFAESGFSARFLIKSVSISDSSTGGTLWVLHFHSSVSPIRQRHEREIMLRITSVPISTLMEETDGLPPEEPAKAHTISEMLQMIMEYLGGQGALLFRSQNQSSPVVVGQAGLSKEGLAALLERLERGRKAGEEWQGILAESTAAGLVFTLGDDYRQDAFLADLAAYFPFPCAEIWVDGIGGYGAAVTFFPKPANREGRQFSTEANVRLGRHMESATFSRSMYLAYKELQRTQERIIQAGKMAALGEMAAGIAHELRQPVTAINNFMSNIFTHIENAQFKKISDKLDEYRARSKRNIDRVTRIVDHLLTFARQDTTRFQETDLRELFDEMFKTFFENQLQSHQIEVQWEVADDLPKIQLDPQRIEQVILNLVTNARDAVEGRPDPRIVIGAERDGERLRIFVDDNGPGIPDDIRDKVLDPFFSTKPVGKGTGLGLSISHGIVENHNGEIQVENIPSGGARFTIWLPITQNISTRRDAKP